VLADADHHATRDETGSGFAAFPEPQALKIPLRSLIDQSARLRQPGSIIASIGEMCRSGCREGFTSAKRSADPARLATNRRSVSAAS
jgi:hypothetical protein